MEWVQPNSAGSNENTSWYLTRSQWATSASSWIQESRSFKSNLLNNFPCHCLTVSLGVWESWDSSAPSSNCSPLGGSGRGNAATALATGVFFQRVCEYAVLFHTTTTAFLLPFLNSVYVFCTVRACGKEPSWVHKACTMTLMHSPMYALPVFTGTIQEEKGSIVSTFWVYIKWSSSFIPTFSSWPSPTSMGIILCTDRRCATLALAHSITKASISAPFITLTTQLIVGVPRMTGTWAAKLERSGITRAIWSSL